MRQRYAKNDALLTSSTKRFPAATNAATNDLRFFDIMVHPYRDGRTAPWHVGKRRRNREFNVLGQPMTEAP